MKFLLVLLSIVMFTLIGCSSVTKVGKLTWSITVDEPALTAASEPVTGEGIPPS